ncbi:MAG: hypothetical protein HYZ28_08290 [Myxococcales bacterium]|nr:hypothetical protein [Myxococcales bacterium]
MRGATGLSGLALAACLMACPGPLSSLRYRAGVHTGAGEFELEYAERDAGDRLRVQEAIERAAPKLARWGALREPVSVRIMPNHRLLEEAVDRRGFGWLRAWARYDEVFVQAPRTWSLFGASQGEVDELMLHELTHCVMYQASATRTSWSRKQIPLWFREGMASLTADQGYRWPSLEDLARFYEAEPEVDPVAGPDGLYQAQSDIVYGAAHHVFAFLVRRHGDAAVRATMARMSGTEAFPEAFTAAVGASPASFVEDFRRYVRLRGFRGGRLIRKVPPVHLATPPEPPPEPSPPPPAPPPPDARGCTMK